MSVSITEEQFKRFGRCAFLDNGVIRLGVTLDVGPRIVYFSLKGKENIMLEDDGKVFSEDTEDYGTWYTYGGHRLWCSPEINPETYYPDNDKVDYTFEGGVLTLKPKPTPFGKEFVMEITMDETGPMVSLRHSIKNVSDKPATYAAWSITAMTVGGTCFVPMSNKKTGYLANRSIVLWDYVDIYDSRVKFDNYSMILKQDVNAKGPFKVGFNSEDGFAAYAVNGQVFVKTFPPFDLSVTYPDYDSNVEVYTNPLFLECECLGEIREFAPGEAAVITESWCVYDNDIDFAAAPDDIKAGIQKHIDEIQSK